ncbi:TadE/TadG family type IV pilus assembly protein [Streptomyces sp. NPDC050848]|uniref:TadE/TadG family type IV pilus assembly protein n=1 Tax=Streptomyces sp. NPDC050848 TaxID=3155791 RepID=UPI00340784CA
MSRRDWGDGRGGSDQGIDRGDGQGIDREDDRGGSELRVRALASRVRALTRRRDRGQVAVEYLGFLPILLLIALAGIQLGLAAYAAQQAGTGARAAARAAGHDDATIGPEPAGRAAMSDWIAARARVDVVEGGGEAVATVSVDIPSVVPFWDFGRIEKTATLPVPEEGE